ncbi:MAG: hypothetical protein HQ509_01285 [Candidatus Marinimicrobia bacterium]|nr:hypothetical protein [Candidatus Neomarinimicrobiota bacterium]
MTRQIKFRKLLPDRHKKGRSITWLAGMAIAILWLIKYLFTIATTQ